ncbi:30S ribosomal protein S19e [Candidatus Woesearchaeota archaeon]|nr:30S ribosomal protein S19e [Candidatus Woesearchaeota archaeon]
MAIYDVPAEELIGKTAQELKTIKEIAPPSWATFVKTGAHKQRPPVNKDWWYVRTASLLRKIAIKGPIGTSKLRTLYGGRKRRGYDSETFLPGSGSIIRKILQQLDKAGFTIQEMKKIHKGRMIAPKGMAFLDKIAGTIMKERNIIFPPTMKEDIKQVKEVKKRAPRKKKKVETQKEEANGKE